MEKELFIPYELALKLKELGFNEKCLGGYDKTKKWWYHPDSDVILDVPLWSQAFDWLLINFNFWQYTFPNAHNKDWCYHIQWYKESFGWGESFIQNGFKTQEEARLECLKKLIELCEKN